MATLRTAAALDSGDDAYWSSPPCSDDGQPILVDVRFNLNKVAAVDTMKSTAYVSIGVAFYWTDPRLKSWTEASLPPKLWGPRCWLFNALPDLQEIPQDFGLTDAAAGRMKRYSRYMGTLDNAMCLWDFPFDTNTIDLTFRSASHWTCLDGSRQGDLHSGQSYRFRPVCEGGEGSLFQLLWDGSIPEFSLLGLSMHVKEKPRTLSGQQVTELLVSFHVSRRSRYYVSKVLLPIYLLTFLSFFVFSLEITDIANRLNLVVTLFLASFAMLYVIGEHLPKTDFLTNIDVIIITTTVSLVMVGFAACLMNAYHKQIGEADAVYWNGILPGVLALVQVVAGLLYLLPPCRRRHRTQRMLACESTKEDHFKYLPLDSIRPRSEAKSLIAPHMR